MELLVNERSLHGQFRDVAHFRDSLGAIMAIRNLVRTFDNELRCARGIETASVAPGKTLIQLLQTLSRDQQRSVMQWLTAYGPFWDDQRAHDDDDYFECNGDVVTASAIAEAAHGHFRGLDRRLISFAPSDWTDSPIPVIWRTGAAEEPTCDLTNYWRIEDVRDALRGAPRPISSWDELETMARQRLDRLTFSTETFEPLRGFPFSSAGAARIGLLLETLDTLGRSFAPDGRWTDAGREIIEKHFTGERAWFSDSSATEKADFERGLTFPLPERPGETLFCPWHGKVNTPLLRVHFSWPITADLPIYVLHVGQKITRR